MIEFSLLETRFDCFSKCDTIMFKAWLREGAAKVHSQRSMRFLNRWRLFPLLQPFGAGDEEVHALYPLTVRKFLQKYYSVFDTNNIGEEVAQQICSDWICKVKQSIELKHQTMIPVKLCQTTWNIEGEKQVCYTDCATRHREVKMCIKKGPLLLQEIRASDTELNQWQRTFPNTKLIATEGRSRVEQASPSRPGGFPPGRFSFTCLNPDTDDLDAATQELTQFEKCYELTRSQEPVCRESDTNPLQSKNSQDRQGGVGIAWDTLQWGIESDFSILVEHFVVQVTFAKSDGTVTYVSAYLRPGEQALIINKWRDAWRRHPPRGMLLVAGDFNCKSKEQWAGLTDLMDEFGLSLMQCEDDTYRRKGGYKSTLDHWFVRASTLESGQCQVNVSRWYSKTWKAEHARVRLFISTQIRAQEGVAAHAVPGAALSRGASAFPLLARKVRAIDESDSTNYLTKLRGIVWAWFRGTANDFYEKKKKVLQLRSFLRSKATRVLIPSDIMVLSLKHVDMGIQIKEFQHETHAGIESVWVSKELLRDIVEKLDFLETHTNTGQPEETLIRATYTTIRQPILYKRIRALFPKFTGSLGSLKDAQGKMTSSLNEIDKLVRSTRGFWVEEPEIIEQSLMDKLHQYAKNSPKWTSSETPPLEFFKQAVIVSGDSAVGNDTIPFAAHRIDPDKTARLMQRRLVEIVSKKVPPPRQLLVWIPKAVVGFHADDWRPLGMPSTFDRIFAAAVYKWTTESNIDILHSSQALLNDLREPQVNFKAINEKFRQTWTRKSPLTGVLFTDLQKAFEYVHPAWIIAVLTARGAPRWLIKYTQYTFYKKQVIPKIQGRCLTPLQVLTGVDMGNAISPFLFCLAIDPLLRAINSIDNVIIMKCYMDDNSTVIQSMSPLPEIQKEFNLFHSAGIRVLKHECAFVKIVLEGKVEFTRRSTSWQRAIRQALTIEDPKSKAQFFMGNSDRRVSRKHLRFLLTPDGRDALARIIVQPCTCKCKTAIVWNQRLDSRDLVELDAMPWGAKVLVAVTTSLGLPFVGRFKKPYWISPMGHTQKKFQKKKGWHERAHKDRTTGFYQKGAKFTVKELATMAHSKARKKILTRERKYKHLINPVYSSLETHLSAVQSTTYYSASLFPPTKEIITERNLSMARAICPSKWIAAEFLPCVARFVKAVGGQTYQSASLLAKIGLAIRCEGVKNVWSRSSKPGSDLRFLQEQVAKVIQALDEAGILTTNSAVAEKVATAANGKHILQEWFKLSFKQIDNARGKKFLSKRFSDFGLYTPVQVEILLQTFGECPKSLVHPSLKLGALRWLLGADYDDIKKLHVSGGHLPPKCRECHQLGVCPLAGLQESVCFEHKKKLQVSEDVPSSGCVYCGHEGNHARHWLVQCPVVNQAIYEVYAISEGFMGLVQEARSKRPEDQARVIYASFQIRNLTLAAHAMEPEKSPCYSLTPTQWIRKIAACLSREKITQPPLQCPCDFTHMQSFVPTAGLPAVGARKSFRKGFKVATTIVNKGEFICCAPEASCALNLMHTLKQCKDVIKQGEMGQLGMVTNAIAIKGVCACGLPKSQLMATRSIAHGEPIVVPFKHPVQRGNVLIIQFDGSTRAAGTRFACGGAGVVVWKVQGEHITLIDWGLFPGRSLVNAALSEAKGAMEAVRMAEKHFTADTTGLIIQGDNSSVISFFQGMAKSKQMLMAEMFFETDRRAQRLPIGIQWEYIPREANPWADHLAGEASMAALNMLIDGEVVEEFNDPWGTYCEPPLVEPDWWEANGGQGALIELPPEEIEDIHSLVHAIKGLTWHKKLLAIRNYHHRGARKIMYTPRRADREGRMYPSSPFAAAWCCKELRYLFFGKGNVEIDISGSFFAIALEVSQDFKAATGFKSVRTIRGWLTEVLCGTELLRKRPGFPKELLTRLLNTPLEQLMTWVREISWFYPEVLYTWVKKVYKATRFLLHNEIPGVIAQDDPRVRPHNRVYFILENWEARFMRCFIENFVSSAHVAHLIWIHDAIWVASDLRDQAIDAFEATKRKFGWNQIEAKVSDLTEIRGTVIEELRANAMNGRITTVNERLPDLPEAPSTRIKTRLGAFRLNAAHVNSLNKYFKRKKSDERAVPKMIAAKVKKRHLKDSFKQVSLSVFFASKI